MATRNQIFDALLSLTDLVTGPLLPLKQRSRRAVASDVVGQELMPSLYQIERAEPVTAQPGMPPIFRFDVIWIVYINVGSAPNDIHSTPINDILDILIGVLAPPPGQENQTLGGRVARVYPGAAEIHEGLIGDIAQITLPINIVWPPEFDPASC